MPSPARIAQVPAPPSLKWRSGEQCTGQGLRTLRSPGIRCALVRAGQPLGGERVQTVAGEETGERCILLCAVSPPGAAPPQACQSWPTPEQGGPARASLSWGQGPVGGRGILTSLCVSQESTTSGTEWTPPSCSARPDGEEGGQPQAEHGEVPAGVSRPPGFTLPSRPGHPGHSAPDQPPAFKMVWWWRILKQT